MKTDPPVNEQQEHMQKLASSYAGLSQVSIRNVVEQMSNIGDNLKFPSTISPAAALTRY